MQSAMEMRLAVLIDADNVPHDRITGMMKEIARYGTPTIKRIYGDWTKPDLKGWKNILLSHAITPVQQYRYTVGKNATDSAMIIDAMDMLYAGNLDGFCIVSSDSDFTRLAIRLRESGKRVFGMGERKTPKPFIVACDKFTYIEIIDMTVEKTEDELEPVRRAAGTRTAGGLRTGSGKLDAAAKPDVAVPIAGSPVITPAASSASTVSSASAASPAAAAAPAGKTETGKGNGDRIGGVRPVIRQDPGKGRSRRINVAQRVEERPEAVLTTQVHLVQPASEETATAGSGHQSPSKMEHATEHTTEHAAEPVSTLQPAFSTERSAETSHPIVEAVNREIIDLIGTSITDLADENGWAFLGDVGTLIAKKKPDFDPRNYGFVKLTPLIRSLDMFELDIRETSQFHIKHVYVRNRKRQND